MPSIRRRGWEIPDREVTSEAVFWNRRHVLQAMGFTGLGLAAGLRPGPASAAAKNGKAIPGLQEKPPVPDLYPAKRNPKFNLDLPLSDEYAASTYNNFYEFSDSKDAWPLGEKFVTHPWTVEVSGLVKKPRTWDVEEILRKVPLEERVYRFRCVEAWSMVVPWTGIPLAAFVKLVDPLPSAKFIRFTTFMRPDQAPGQKPSFFGRLPWPYTEGLTVGEATNELAMLVTGMYGHPTPKQNGAPFRLIAPWKYGYKNIKSIVKMEFITDQPATFWNTLVPHEYDFWSNVNPKVPHPRWSQATERLVDTGERKPTLLYNGYAEFVAHLYKS
jgi:sulfoxide reductase catalytic subunit YedY